MRSYEGKRFQLDKNYVASISDIIRYEDYTICKATSHISFEKTKYLKKAKNLIARNHLTIVFTRRNSIPIKLKAPLAVVNEIFSNQLAVGDIISVDSDAHINILYDSRSKDNIVFATNRCNSKCIMCPQPPQDDPIGFQEEQDQLLSLVPFDCIKHIGITGGEPTLLGDRLVNIISKIVSRSNPPWINLLTNARKLRDFNYTKEIVLASRGRIIFDVPLYSHDEGEHNSIVGNVKAYDETLEGIYNLALLKQKIGIRVVLIKPNINSLIELSEFIYRNMPFVYQVAFMGMETTGYAKDHIDDVWIDPFDYRAKLGRACQYLDVRYIPVSIYNLPLCLINKSEWKFSRRSISDWKECYHDVCAGCVERINCCGLFSTSAFNSKHLTPIFDRSLQNL